MLAAVTQSQGTAGSIQTLAENVPKIVLEEICTMAQLGSVAQAGEHLVGEGGAPTPDTEA